MEKSAILKIPRSFDIHNFFFELLFLYVSHIPRRRFSSFLESYDKKNLKVYSLLSSKFSRNSMSSTFMGIFSCFFFNTSKIFSSSNNFFLLKYCYHKSRLKKHSADSSLPKKLLFARILSFFSGNSKRRNRIMTVRKKRDEIGFWRWGNWSKIRLLKSFKGRLIISLERNNNREKTATKNQVKV